MLHAKGERFGAPTCSRLYGHDDGESRLKIGAPEPNNPDISCYTRKANGLERRLAVGFTVTMMLQAD